MPDESGWKEYQKLVMHQLRDHKDELAAIRRHVLKIEVDIAKLKVRAGMWGMVAGLLVSAAALLSKLYNK